MKIKGELEIDSERGVIYFHTTNKKIIGMFKSVTLLRICGLRKPIDLSNLIDLTFHEKELLPPQVSRAANDAVAWQRLK